MLAIVLRHPDCTSDHFPSITSPIRRHVLGPMLSGLLSTLPYSTPLTSVQVPSDPYETRSHAGCVRLAHHAAFQLKMACASHQGLNALSAASTSVDASRPSVPLEAQKTRAFPRSRAPAGISLPRGETVVLPLEITPTPSCPTSAQVGNTSKFCFDLASLDMAFTVELHCAPKINVHMHLEEFHVARNSGEEGIEFRPRSKCISIHDPGASLCSIVAPSVMRTSQFVEFESSPRNLTPEFNACRGPISTSV